MNCLYICVCSAIIVSCANRMPPSGGPTDKTPATVIATTPANKSVNVVDKTITFEFNDYVDRGIKNAITIQPTARFSSDYAGDELSITIEDELLPNTTYAVMLGTDWKDLRGNPPPAATTVIFSTGPNLDSGTIIGNVSAPSNADLFVFAYPNANSLDTSFSPAIDPCVYRIPVGTSGDFLIGGLKDGLYRCLTSRDKNKNKLVDVGEEFAIESSDIEIRNGISRKSVMRIDPQIDTTTKAQKPAPSDTTKADTSLRIEPGSASGVFADSSNLGPPYLVRFLDKSGRVVVALPVVQGENWTVDSIAPGTYTIDVIQDRNLNNLYDVGAIRPFQFGERWKPSGISITIRERWSTDDVKLILR